MTIFFQKLFFKNNRIKNDADRFHKSDRFKIFHYFVSKSSKLVGRFS